jgi:hypothetical protein
MFTEVHDEVAGLLGRPEPVGMRSHAQDVQVAIADLQSEQDVEPPQRHRAVDVEEVDREHAGGLCAQELPPPGVGVADRRRWDPVALEDATDRRGADTMAEFEQLALDPPIAPARVVPRHPRHQRGKDVVDRWPSNRFGWVHFLRTRRRCQRRMVPGVTRRWRRRPLGCHRMRAANTARSAQSTPGLGLARRRTATS